MSQQEPTPPSADTENNATQQPGHEIETMPSLEELLKEAERQAKEHYDA